MISTDASARVAPLTAKRESSAVDVKAPSPRSPKDQSRPVIKPLLKSHRDLKRPPFDCIALVLQGGGALGAFQAGVYQGLAEANLHPDWVAGISIGAINAALIAGNAPEARLEKLRAFWEQVTTQLLFDSLRRRALLAARRYRLTSCSTGCAPERPCSRGLPAFSSREFRRLTSAPPGTVEATSWYDTSPLRSTLERLVDFDRINAGEMRFSVGAVNIRSGNFVYFDIDHPHDQARAHHGERRAAARLSGRRDGRRTLLGRRARLQHAAAMGGGGRYPPGHARVPGRPVERTRRVAVRSATM